MTHVLEMLSEFIDGALSDKDRRAVESHLSACSSCREQLDELKGAISAAASLKNRPLPPGFLARLQARRHRHESAKRDYAFLPFPARMAAFALSSFIVGFVVFESYRNKPSQMIPASDGLPLNADLAAPSSSELDGLRKAAQAEAELQRMRADEEMGRKASAKSRSLRGLAAARGSAPGQPLELEGAGYGGGTTSLAPAPKPAAPAYSNEELNARLEREKREMGIQRVIGNAEKRAERAAELATPRGFAAALGLADQSQAVALGGATPDLKGSLARQATPKAVVAPFGGAVGRDVQELREAWREAELPGVPPLVDFEKHSVVIPPGVMVDVRESQGIIIVRYRPGPRQYALIERTQLPIAFELKR
jgi:hypothetical protein